MPKKVVVLVDGQNLYYGLKNMGLMEKQLKWNTLFRSLIEEGDELIRIYWFRPQRVHDGHLTPESIRAQIFSRDYRPYFDTYKTGEFHSIPEEILAEVERKAKEVEDFIKERKMNFDAVEFNYDQLCLDNEDIEIVKKGILKIRPFEREVSGEKGVDVALAVKMISLSVENKCDKIILVSGDYDYAEAINYVKNNMTKVHIVKLHKGYPPRNKNMSRDLSVLADKIIDLYEKQIREKYFR